MYFTFCLPLAIVIISNLGMLVAVVFKIKQTRSVSRNVKNKRNTMIIVAKLSTITGATWIFGFIYLWTDIKLFSYLFIVLNASQGLFLCFALQRAVNIFETLERINRQYPAKLLYLHVNCNCNTTLVLCMMHV